MADFKSSQNVDLFSRDIQETVQVSVISRPSSIPTDTDFDLTSPTAYYAFWGGADVPSVFSESLPSSTWPCTPRHEDFPGGIPALDSMLVPYANQTKQTDVVPSLLRKSG